MSSETHLRHLSVRRLLLMIAEALDESLRWAVFEPHTGGLREAIRLAIGGFLESLWAQGALNGAVAGESYFVRCDGENNPPDSMAAGRLVADVGLVPSIPAEWIVFRIGRTDDGFQIESLGEGGTA